MIWKDDAKRGRTTTTCGPFEAIVEEGEATGVHIMINCETRRVHGEYSTASIEIGREKAERMLLEWCTKMLQDLAKHR
jgi:hypothetical protein